MWICKPAYVDKNLTGASDAILRILKKAARDIRKTLTVIALELMFRLLTKFATDKHASAPTVYKTFGLLRMLKNRMKTDFRSTRIRNMLLLSVKTRKNRM